MQLRAVVFSLCLKKRTLWLLYCLKKRIYPQPGAKTALNG